MGERMEPHHDDHVAGAVLHAVQKQFTAERMQKIKARTLCSNDAMAVISDTLCKVFDDSTRRWRKRALELDDLHLHREDHMPQLPA